MSLEECQQILDKYCIFTVIMDNYWADRGNPRPMFWYIYVFLILEICMLWLLLITGTAYGCWGSLSPLVKMY